MFKILLGASFIIALNFQLAELLAFNNNENANAPIETIINELFDKVNSYQVLKEQNYAPPFKWAEKLGLYRSDIRVNLFGNPLVSALRNGELTAIFDNDMFSTGWIITVLLEATLYGKGAPALSEARLRLALEAINNYHNHNDNNFQHSLLRSFWPQVYNETDNLWNQQPINIRNVALNIDKIPWNEIEKVLKALNLDKLANIAQMIQYLGSMSIDAFCIPIDFDDSYLNLGLGATLYKLNSIYPDIYKDWTLNNSDTKHLIESTTKYAYKPFDSDINKNMIDPRTFFWARNFIQKASDEKKPLGLITTWVQNIDEQRVLKDKKISMPFNLNNVDVTVAANSIYGITSGSIFNVNGFGDLFLQSDELQAIYLNSTKFISWAISSNFSARPDLAQVYYPSTYNFLWYASRTLFLIENEYQKFMHRMDNGNMDDVEYLHRFKALQNILFEAKSYLEDAFENMATQFLFKWAIPVGNKKNQVYFRDFLGLNDTSIFDKPEPKDDDALFSTAQAINILISTWTYQNPSDKKLYFKNNTSQDVKNLITSSVNWLKEHVLANKLKALNAFFSGSVKGFTSLPFWYPSNFVQFLNGTTVTNPASLSEADLGNVINGVQGSIDETTYQNLIKQTHFGEPTPLDFVGYNTKENIFPFWASQAYTYACSLLALSQYNNLA